jgi:hypothetical protein
MLIGCCRHGNVFVAVCCRRLEGKLPAHIPTSLLSGAHAAVLQWMSAGVSFAQFYRGAAATGGAGASTNLVKKTVVLKFVPAASEAEGQGRLYWGSEHDPSLSLNRCLPLEKITEFYLYVNRPSTCFSKAP